MITVISLNPSIDRTLTVDALNPGCTNRAISSRVDAGGKGVNVCRYLSAMGAEDVHCVGIMRVSDEALFSSALSAVGVRCDWLTLPGRVRTNTKIIASDGTLTEINEAGTMLTPEEAAAAEDICRKSIAGSSAVVLTGSIPPGISSGIYARLIEAARAQQIPCLLDADGEALKQGIAACPTFIKPNAAELERLLGQALPDLHSQAAAAKALMQNGVPYGCISLGGDGAIFFSDAWILHLPALDVPVRSTVGAGDAMTAAFALGMVRQLGEKETFRLALAASAAAVSTDGTQNIDMAIVQRLLKQVPRPTEITI